MHIVASGQVDNIGAICLIMSRWYAEENNFLTLAHEQERNSRIQRKSYEMIEMCEEIRRFLNTHCDGRFPTCPVYPLELSSRVPSPTFP